MEITRQHLRQLIEVIDASELSLAYQILLKLVPEEIPAPDEVEAIRMGRSEIARGEFTRHEDIDWN